MTPLLVILGVLALTVMAVISIYNKLVGYKSRMQEARGVELKKQRPMLRFRLFTLLLFCLTAMLGQAQEQTADFMMKQERILRFHADIAIDTTGRIEVAEHITVYAAGEEIKRGIVRALPLTRKNKNDKSVRMNYNILAVKCNGADAKYHTDKANGNIDIYVGEADVLLKAGVYEYIFVYESYGQIGFFDDYDELYWNITGTEWIFPIEKASATVTLPDGANVIQTSCYTGVQGATEKACTCNNSDAKSTFAATRRLAPQEGLTVAVGFTRDIIDRSKAATSASHKNAPLFACLFTLICIAYCIVTRLKAGPRPLRQLAIPFFRPPRDMPPAAVIYLKDLKQKEFKKKAFAATLINMAVKGALTIRCDTKLLNSFIDKWLPAEYTLINKKNTERLLPEEQQIHTTLFAESDELKVKDDNYEKFQKAEISLLSSVRSQWKFSDFFNENRKIVGWGGLLLNVLFTVYMLINLNGETAFALFVACPFVSLEMYYFSAAIIVGRSFGRKPNIIIGCTAAFCFAGMMMAITDYDSEDMHALSWFFFTVPSLIYSLYARNMRRYTPDGAKLAAELEGFKMYMKIAEEHRLNLLNPPNRTPELFEKLLPYAMALGVSNEWCNKFGRVLELANYHPDWYDGGSNFSGITTAAGMVAAFSALSASFNASVGVASVSPSSGSSDWSSGSGGGGSSGGGGGGGGGRGW